MRRWLGTGAGRNPVHDLETGRIDAAEFERLLAAELLEHTAARPGPRPTGPAGMLTRMFAGMRVEASMIDASAPARDGRRPHRVAVELLGSGLRARAAGTRSSTPS